MKRNPGVALALFSLILIAATLAAAGQNQLGNDGLHVGEALFCEAVTDRMPEGSAESFPTGQRVYCWTRVLDGVAGNFIYHVWFHEGREIQSVELAVEAGHWRTWSYKTLFPGQLGAWRVEIQNAQGELLGSYDFRATE
jgi:hypothetical protein